MQDKPNVEHLRWAIDQRAKIQHTLLTLYLFLDTHDPNKEAWHKTTFVDDLVASAFSLWRAAFLAENLRLFENIQKAQREFLKKVISTNSITFTDDKSNDAWTFGFYLYNALYRLKSAYGIVGSGLDQSDRFKLDYCFRIHAVANAQDNRYQWELLHCALRLLFACLSPNGSLDVEWPKPIPNHPFYNIDLAN